jgi:hypothetical protein
MCSGGQPVSAQIPEAIWPPEQKSSLLMFHHPCKVGFLVNNMEQCSIMAVPEPCKPQPKNEDCVALGVWELIVTQ